MILYTMMPPELIFPQESMEPTKQTMFDLEGIPLLVEMESDGYRVIRVMSSDPAHYLDSRVVPGAKISYF